MHLFQEKRTCSSGEQKQVQSRNFLPCTTGGTHHRSTQSEDLATHLSSLCPSVPVAWFSTLFPGIIKTAQLSALVPRKTDLDTRRFTRAKEPTLSPCWKNSDTTRSATWRCMCHGLQMDAMSQDVIKTLRNNSRCSGSSKLNSPDSIRGKNFFRTLKKSLRPSGGFTRRKETFPFQGPCFFDPCLNQRFTPKSDEGRFLMKIWMNRHQVEWGA